MKDWFAAFFGTVAVILCILAFCLAFVIQNTPKEIDSGCVTLKIDHDGTHTLLLNNETVCYVTEKAFNSVNVGDFVKVYEDGSIEKVK